MSDDEELRDKWRAIEEIVRAHIPSWHRDVVLSLVQAIWDERYEAGYQNGWYENR